MLQFIGSCEVGRRNKLDSVEGVFLMEEIELLYDSTLRITVEEKPSLDDKRITYDGRDLEFTFLFESLHPDELVSYSFIQTQATRQSNADFPNYRLQFLVKPDSILIW